MLFLEDRPILNVTCGIIRGTNDGQEIAIQGFGNECPDGGGLYGTRRIRLRFLPLTVRNSRNLGPDGILAKDRLESCGELP
jgi:hypothetical protein